MVDGPLLWIIVDIAKGDVPDFFRNFLDCDFGRLKGTEMLNFAYPKRLAKWLAGANVEKS